MKKTIVFVLITVLAAALVLGGCVSRRPADSFTAGMGSGTGENGGNPAGMADPENAGKNGAAGTYRLAYLAVGNTFDTGKTIYATAEQFLKLLASDPEDPDYVAPEETESVRKQMSEECIILREDGTGELHLPWLFGKSTEILWRQDGSAVSLIDPAGGSNVFSCWLEGDRLMPDLSEEPEASGGAEYPFIFSSRDSLSPEESSESAAGTYPFRYVAEDGKITEAEDLEEETAGSGITLREDGTGELRLGEDVMEILWWQEGAYLYLTSLGSGESFRLLPCPFDGTEIRFYVGAGNPPDFESGNYFGFTKNP